MAELHPHPGWSRAHAKSRIGRECSARLVLRLIEDAYHWFFISLVICKGACPIDDSLLYNMQRLTHESLLYVKIDPWFPVIYVMTDWMVPCFVCYRYKTQPADGVEGVELRQKKKYSSRHYTQPITPDEKLEAETSATFPEVEKTGSISDRYADHCLSVSS